MTAPDLLVSDREREVAADRLRAAAGEGRLTAEELADRVGHVYAARTHGELTEALRGLPSVPARRRRSVQGRLLALASWWIPPNAISILVWLVSGTNGDFWPKWVLLATTIAVLGRGRRLLRPPPPPPLPRLPHDTGPRD